jgi:hypothetical protein
MAVGIPSMGPGRRVIVGLDPSEQEDACLTPLTSKTCPQSGWNRRYYRTKYDHSFAVSPANDAQDVVDRVSRILEEERDIVIASPPLEATEFEVDGLRMSYVFYQSGLAINVMYSIQDGGKRAVGFKLSDGMELPEELATRFKFARQKSKLAGVIRGSFFVIKGEY